MRLGAQQEEMCMGVMFKDSSAGRRSMSKSSRSAAVRKLQCGEVMEAPHMLDAKASVSKVIHVMTENNWDHLFLVDEYLLPVGRVHAVDLLKMVDLKRVNRDMAWAEAVPALQCVSTPPLSVKENTPLLKAVVLLLTHDLNQLAVVDEEGALIGMVGVGTAARHLPRFIL
jgi:CBS domain-containing protein